MAPGSRPGGRGLGRTSRQWERLGATDPLYAVLGENKERGSWDVDEFMASGREHVVWVLAYLSTLGVSVRRDNALDFGCGVGRLTAALADEFEHVDGVDLSQSMVDQARQLNLERASFHVNPRPDLALFEDGRFDLVLSYLVLQHIPTPLALTYIHEFVRLLAPGGVAVFQAPDALARPTNARDSRILGPRLRNLASRAKGVVLRRPVMEMHMIPTRKVEEVVRAAGGEAVEVSEDWTGGDFCRSIRYIVRRPEPGEAGVSTGGG